MKISHLIPLAGAIVGLSACSKSETTLTPVQESNKKKIHTIMKANPDGRVFTSPTGSGTLTVGVTRGKGSVGLKVPSTNPKFEIFDINADGVIDGLLMKLPGKEEVYVSREDENLTADLEERCNTLLEAALSKVQ